MKKFFILAAICLVAASCSTPKIAINTTNKGARILLTSNSSLFRFNDNKMYAALGVKMEKTDTIMGILITYDGDTGKGIFSRGDKMMFRLKDGKEFSLVNMYDKEYESKSETTTSSRMQTDYAISYSYSPWTGGFYFDPIMVSHWVPEVYTTKITNSYGLYLINKAQIKGILETGVSKLRIESELGDADMPEPEEVQEIFQTLFDLLVEAASGKDTSSF